MPLQNRCQWCNLKNERCVLYHDTEWGVPRFDDKYLYEMLLLECFQAGLSWECVLNKREDFRDAYDGFEIARVIGYNEKKVSELLDNPHLIRNRRKILASIENSRVFYAIVSEYGSFYDYLKRFTRGNIYIELNRTSNALSDALSRDLKARGMRFVGSVTIYAYLQAIGVIDSHEKECWLHHRQSKSTSVSDEANGCFVFDEPITDDH